MGRSFFHAEKTDWGGDLGLLPWNYLAHEMKTYNTLRENKVYFV